MRQAMKVGPNEQRRLDVDNPSLRGLRHQLIYLFGEGQAGFSHVYRIRRNVFSVGRTMLGVLRDEQEELVGCGVRLLRSGPKGPGLVSSRSLRESATEECNDQNYPGLRHRTGDHRGRV